MVNNYGEPVDYLDDLVFYYFGIVDDPVGQAGLNFWENRCRMNINNQYSCLDLQSWCSEFDWVGR